MIENLKDSYLLEDGADKGIVKMHDVAIWISSSFNFLSMDVTHFYWNSNQEEWEKERTETLKDLLWNAWIY